MESHEFFLVTLPGLEDLALAEVHSWYPEWPARAEHGGVVVEAPLAAGLGMNQVLKTPTRILVRVTSFVARDFPKLFKKISELPWHEWIDPSCTLTAHASATRSRLKMKKRIEETAEKAWRNFQKHQKSESSADHHVQLYIRLHDNTCTLSLDTSGERLHKRGVRTHVGEAPLRETIAAALLLLVRKHAMDTRPVELIDPMMGSGVFLLEATTLDTRLETRLADRPTFANKPEAVPLKPTGTGPRPSWAHLRGFENDDKTLKAARHNLRELGPDWTWEVIEQDIFTAAALPPTPHQRWVVNNPPYGERLRVKTPLKDYYAELFAAVERVARPDLACFLLPAKASGRLDLPPAWKVREKRRFSNGGIPVVAFVFTRN